MNAKEVVEAGGRAADAAKGEFGRAWFRLSLDARRGAIAAHVVATFESFGGELAAHDVVAVMRLAWTSGGCDEYTAPTVSLSAARETREQGEGPCF